MVMFLSKNLELHVDWQLGQYFIQFLIFTAVIWHSVVPFLTTVGHTILLRAVLVVMYSVVILTIEALCYKPEGRGFDSQ
jgi:hypothetical protein